MIGHTGKELAMSRIVGSGRRSLIIDLGNTGKMVFCSTKCYAYLVNNQDATFEIQTVPAHEDTRTGRYFSESKWIAACIPTRF